MDFRDKLTKRQETSGSILGISLNPTWENMPGRFQRAGCDSFVSEKFYWWMCWVVDSTADHVSLFSLDVKNWRGTGNGTYAFRELVKYIRGAYPDIPVLLSDEDVVENPDAVILDLSSLNLKTIYPKRMGLAVPVLNSWFWRNHQIPHSPWFCAAKQLSAMGNRNIGLIINYDIVACREIAKDSLWMMVPSNSGDLSKEVYSGPGSAVILSSLVMISKNPENSAMRLKERINKTIS